MNYIIPSIIQKQSEVDQDYKPCLFTRSLYTQHQPYCTHVYDVRPFFSFNAKKNQTNYLVRSFLGHTRTALKFKATAGVFAPAQCRAPHADMAHIFRFTIPVITSGYSGRQSYVHAPTTCDTTELHSFICFKCRFIVFKGFLYRK